MHLSDPQATLTTLITFIQDTFAAQGKNWGVIAVSGGIDSALSLSLATRALGPERIRPVFLPYQNQSTADAEAICDWNQIPEAQRHVLNIEPVVRAAAEVAGLEETDQKGTGHAIRMGNMMARSRMILVYDLAKTWDGLVIGTENKSEHYLGYFTRFGDAASDLEPIASLYKTQVRQLAATLQIPSALLTKAPSAGLWPNQTDETELGFTYEQADLVLEQLIDHSKKPDQIQVAGVDPTVVAAVCKQVAAVAFKLQVPYQLDPVGK